jgi:hypothetical protein
MSEITSKHIGGMQVQAIYDAPAAVRAAAYLRRLDQISDYAGDCALVEIQVQYFQRLRSDLEAATRKFQKSSAGWTESVEDFESYSELDWICNLCEYWMGPADCANVSRLYQKIAEMKRRPPAMTCREFMAVRLLVLAASILIQVMRNPMVLWPRPMPVYRWLKTKSQEACVQLSFGLKRKRRRFLLWLKMVFLRFS